MAAVKIDARASITRNLPPPIRPYLIHGPRAAGARGASLMMAL
jgi:hypothetical protein